MRTQTPSNHRGPARGIRRGLCSLGLVVVAAAMTACGSDASDSSGSGGFGAQGVGGGTATGGVSTGGVSTGGVSTGGVSTGGVSTGGVSTGGVSTGGVSTGGVSTGGSSGSGGNDGVGGVSSSGGSGGTGGDSGTGGGGGTGGVAGFNPCPTTSGEACRIMPVGDSITEGCCKQPMGGYRIELYRQALANMKNITFVGTLQNGPSTVDGQPFPKDHEGHGGWKISQIAGVADNAISSSDPDIILLKIGTNDINGNDDIANAPNRLANLIDQITTDAPSALVVVSAIIPTTNSGTDQKFQAYNAAIEVKATEAAAAGKHVVWVDNYAVFAERSDFGALMADSLHPNDAGYVVLGQSFYDVISDLLPAAP